MPLFLFSIFVVATCGLIYELVAGTLASYLLGDSVTQFSTIIGVYLFSMGIGSYLSKFFQKNLIGWFIQIELLVGLVGGCTSSILFLLFEQVAYFRLLLYFLIALTGILVGLEIPLLMRILKNKIQFKVLVSQVFTFDYIGALAASIIFPLVLVPYFGLLKTSFFFGILNVAVALILCSRYEKETVWANKLKVAGWAAMLLLVIGFVFSERIMSFSESLAYHDKIIYSKSSAYQRIVITRAGADIRLFLNNNLQFSSTDEYRYHEAIIHPGIQSVKNPAKVLVLGGGDGMALREILKYKAVQSAVLVDLDKEVTKLFSSNKILLDLNKSSLLSTKVTIVNEDAFQWLRQNKIEFDFIAVDFPDPSNYSIGKLYSNTFFKLLYKSLATHGVAVIQATSPYVAPKSFWCINNTVKSVGFITIPFHTYVPSFGEWGYVMARKDYAFALPHHFLDDLRYINQSTFLQMMAFPKDIPALDTDINKLNNQALVHYFEEEWNAYLHL